MSLCGSRLQSRRRGVDSTRVETTQRLAFPGRFRFSLRDQAGADATILDLPARRMWPASLIVAAMFAIFAGVEWTTISRLANWSVRDVSDLVFLLF